MNSCIIDKFYSKEDGLFHIIQEKKYSFEKQEKIYNTIDEFYKALNKNLEGANLLDYNFENIQLNKYDLSKNTNFI